MYTRILESLCKNMQNNGTLENGKATGLVVPAAFASVVQGGDACIVVPVCISG